MKVQNMTGKNGRAIPNQIIIFDSEATYFQSYNTIIVKTCFEDDERKTYLDENSWDYSKTTSKYRNQFLGVSTDETKRRIKSGQYILADLNGNN